MAFSSCGPAAIHSEKMETNGEWSYDNKLSSTIDIQDIDKNYDLALKLNHSQEFYYQNIYLQIETVFPDGKKITEPLSLDLANKAGNWIGKCSGETCEIVFSLQDNFKFKNTGKHQFTIGQYSRDRMLEGVNEIELLLFDAQKL